MAHVGCVCAMSSVLTVAVVLWSLSAVGHCVMPGSSASADHNYDHHYDVHQHHTPYYTSWPLRYHHSPWLHKDFIVRPENEPEENSLPNCDDNQTTETSVPDDGGGGDGGGDSGGGDSGGGEGGHIVDGTDNIGEGVTEVGGVEVTEGGEYVDTSPSADVETITKSIGSCTASTVKSECDYEPSPHCVLEMNRKRQQRNAERDKTVNELLDQWYGNTTPNVTRIHIKPPRQQESDNPGHTFEGCEFLTDSLITELCDSERKPARKQVIDRLRLRSCRRFAVDRALAPHLYQLVLNTTECAGILRQLLVLDNLVESMSCEFESVMQRYDCNANWSMWKCADCNMAYREWMCSTFIPYYRNDRLIKPCESICHQVEQRCPYLLPYGKGQYAGEPVFMCIDPNIPFNDAITPDIPYGPPNWCYNQCDLEFCLNEHNEGPVLDCRTSTPSIDQSTDSSNSTTTTTTDDHNSTEPPQWSETVGNQTTASVVNTDSSITEVVLSTTVEQNAQHVTPESAKSSVDPNNPTNSVELGDIYSEEFEVGGKSGTTQPSALSLSSLSEEDYYLVQTGPEPGKQSQSGQYLELEPNYDSRKIDDAFRAYLIDSYEGGQSESTSTANPNYQASFQDIYHEALASTTVESVGDIAGSANAFNVDKDLLLMNEDDQEEWNNFAIAVGGRETHSTTTTVSNSDSHNYFQKTGTKPPKAGKLSSSTVVINAKNAKLESGAKSSNTNKNTEGKSEAKSSENNTNRFRHHNSRSKEQQQKAERAKESGETKKTPTTTNNQKPAQSIQVNIQTEKVHRQKVQIESKQIKQNLQPKTKQSEQKSRIPKDIPRFLKSHLSNKAHTQITSLAMLGCIFMYQIYLVIH